MNDTLDKLSAVNRVLRAAGEHPVSSLSAEGANDVSIAEQILDETSAEVQMAGITCNTERRTLHPDSTGRIVLPKEVLDVGSNPDSLDPYTRSIQPTSRGQFLVDAKTGSSTFTGSVDVILVLGLTFNDLPIAQRLYIADRAARTYQQFAVGDRSTDAVLAEQEQISRARARRQDMAQRKLGVFQGFGGYQKAAIHRYGWARPSSRNG